MQIYAERLSTEQCSFYNDRTEHMLYINAKLCEKKKNKKKEKADRSNMCTPIVLTFHCTLPYYY